MIGPQSRRVSRLLFVVVASAIAACGGAAQTGSVPARSPEPNEPGSIEEAQSQIAAAEAELGGASPSTPAYESPSGGASRESGASSSDSSSTPKAESAPPAPAASPSKGAPQATERSRTSSGAESPCVVPCRALASMRTAVIALCRMTGDDDARCANAKRTLADSEGRARSCSC
jgi:hypothetical protein